MMALTGVVVSFAHGPVLKTDPLSIKSCTSLESLTLSLKQSYGKGILSSVKEDTSSLDSLMDCAEISELPGAYFCYSMLQRNMNRSFTRIGFFMGAAAGFEFGSILPVNSQELLNYQKIVAGHNLPGNTLHLFFEKAGSKVTDEEKALRRLVKTWEDKHQTHYYVVASSVQNMKPALSVLSHEIHHAQYYLQPEYRKVVEDFWLSRVSVKDKLNIKETLASAYNVNPPILLDEFQAYLLQSKAQKDRLQKFVHSYQDLLRSALKKQGIEILAPPDYCDLF